MNDLADIEKRTLTLERILDAPLQLVWDAWTQPDHIAKWWGPPGMETTVLKHDFKEGGEWEYAMKMPDGSDFIADGKYAKIEELKLIESSANFKPMTEGVTIQANFTALDDKTVFVFKVIHPTEEYCKQQEEMGFYNGWNSTFERLNSYLIEQ